MTWEAARSAYPSRVAEGDAWWFRIGEKSFAAPDAKTLVTWAREGRFERNDLVWDPRSQRWSAAREVPELRTVFYPWGVVRWKYDLFLVIWPLYVVIGGAAGLSMILGSIDLGLFSAIRALRWPSTQGRAVTSRINVNVFAGPAATVTRYESEVAYEYEVGGRRVQSTRLDFHPPDEPTIDRARAEAVTDRYPVGQAVAVFYDPANPSNATLDRGEGTLVAFAPGLVLMVVAILILRAWWIRRRATPKATASPTAASLPPL